ncbi:MAG TPA: hypothetical protein VMW54_12480 [Terriglobia bacterium]|nr:hypothetical protein [Terriglobia bacterium]
MKLKQLALFLALFAVAGQAAARKFDARLASVHTVFVAGNSPAASNARKLIFRWTCFRQAPNPQKANAVFQFSQQMSHAQSASARHSKRAVVIATLTSKNGNLLWSKPVSHHAGFMNTGGGSAARKAIFALQNDAFPYARMTFGGVDRRSCPNRPPARPTRRSRKRAWPY